MKNISYCENSTISEAWIAILGYPSNLNDDEISAINNEAKKGFKGIKRIPSLTIIPKTSELHPPFWTSQFSYGNDLYLSRVGHKYLSVHIISRPGDQNKKYTSYSTILKPEIERWLALYNKVLGNPTDFQVASLVFGYCNTFTFDSDKFDAGEYFNINIGADIGNQSAKIASLNSAYTFYDSENKNHISVNLNIQPEIEKNKLELKTQVSTEKKNLSKISIQNTNQILDLAHDLKEKSKDTFFSFATEKTHKLMGAKYAGSSKK